MADTNIVLADAVAARDSARSVGFGWPGRRGLGGSARWQGLLPLPRRLRQLMGPPLCPHWRPSPLPHRRPLHRRQLAGLRPVRAAGAPGGGCHLSAAVAYGQRPSNCRDSHRIRAGGFPWRYLVSSAELQPRSRGPWGKGAATVSSASAAVVYGQRSSTGLDSGELSGTADLLGDIPEVRHG